MLKEPEIRAYCENCEEPLRSDYTYFEDSEGNKFCTEDCADKFHDIKEKEWNE